MSARALEIGIRSQSARASLSASPVQDYRLPDSGRPLRRAQAGNPPTPGSVSRRRKSWRRRNGGERTASARQPPSGDGAGPRMEGQTPARHGDRHRFLLERQGLRAASPRSRTPSRARAGTAPASSACGMAQGATMTTPPKKRCAARSTRACPPNTGLIRTSTRSMPSARPPRPTSRARPMRAGRLMRSRLRRWRLLGRLHRPPCPAAASCGHQRPGKIDIIVVYKVDRLTRSLADFAKLVELFDAQECRSSRSPSSSTPRPPWAGSR